MEESLGLQKIRLELARMQGFPLGASDRGYEFMAPLDAEGHLDKEGWQQGRDRCTVRRFWAAEPEEHGHLVHRGSGWYFHYEGMDAEDDEPIFKFDRHRFVEGEYVSVTEHDGEQRPFKVVSVRPV
ncbi:hypothetical protein HHL28_03810 [Aerophototrophica crusticola]|uniref:Uncharacterized protein n=1 Tax=Aerophototrophica crusticola TaxID=1709002 RepID=A0A858R4F9_9PROT|nr:hypothetical protein HHL28_03810 [Rhodospirillaceae bacterium B3]